MSKLVTGELKVKFAYSLLEILGRYGYLEDSRIAPFEGRASELYKGCRALWFVGGSTPYHLIVISIISDKKSRWPYFWP